MEVVKKTCVSSHCIAFGRSERAEAMKHQLFFLNLYREIPSGIYILTEESRKGKAGFINKEKNAILPEVDQQITRK